MPPIKHSAFKATLPPANKKYAHGQLERASLPRRRQVLFTVISSADSLLRKFSTTTISWKLAPKRQLKPQGKCAPKAKTTSCSPTTSLNSDLTFKTLFH